ncbi:hypothetical protein [Ramlibacter sp.]|uniref:hypothetical protein n=1 Tax=Ramlibacter sp. TaxID=1917967 RepID=UPI00179A6B9C|nr:hypothetical protein [Ramlibacter sp.]MBA2676026.1 hypothetical protein [Ramlibacter sp.]
MEVLDSPVSAAPEQSSLQARTRMVHRGLAADDVVVAFGMMAAGALDDGAETRLRAATAPELPALIGTLLDEGAIDPAKWADLHRAWYRWRIPLGVSSLVWWHLHCRAYGKAGNLAAASDLVESWIQAIDAAPPGKRAQVSAAFTGLAAERVVALRDDITGLDAFVSAVRYGVTLLAVPDAQALDALRRERVSILMTDIEAGGPVPLGLPAVQSRAASLRALCYGRAPRFAQQSTLLNELWSTMPVEERTFVLVHLEQKIASLEIVRLSHGGRVLDNGEIAGVLAACRAQEPSRWSPLEMRIASFAWAWQEAGFSVHELNQTELSVQLLVLLMEHRVGQYQRHVTMDVPQQLPLPELARRYGPLRVALERSQQRCLYFDGGNWERREFLLDKAASMRHYAIPAPLAECFERNFGGSLQPGSSPAQWRQYVAARIEAGKTPTELMIGLAEWAANTDDLPVDYAVFDVPVGVKLDRPWDLEIEEIFCYTGLRADFEAREKAVPLGAVGIANALGQRMRYNAVKKAQNYALVKHMTPQSFLLPDISVAEDAHHGGHYASGIRHACRVPISVGYRGSAWRGIADVRLSRADYAYDRRFREEELEVALRYGIWAKAIADEAYARDMLFDSKYCVNLDDGRDVAGSLGRPA